jgi:hypothetical protein
VVIDPGDVGARLASALAARLATRVPPNVEVSQVGGTLWVTDGRRSSGTPLDFILSETPPPAVGMTGIHAATESSGTSPLFQGTHPPSSDLAVEDVRDPVLVAATNALNRLQDFLSETLTLRWPAPPEGSSGGAFPSLR